MEKTEQKILNTGFRKMFYSRPPEEQQTLKSQILWLMSWTEDQLKNRLTGRTNTRPAEVKLICDTCKINLDDFFPQLAQKADPILS